MKLTDIEQKTLSHKLYSALVLPLKDDEIDEPGLRQLVRYFINHRFAQVGGLIANPEAGEGAYLSREEKRRVLKIVMEEAGGRLPVLAGIFGWTTKEAVELLMNDPETEGIIMIGEIGGGMEAEAAHWIKANGTKPVVGFIAGQTAPAGRRMGHAGAIVGGADDTAAAKMKIMAECGIRVVASPAEIGVAMAEELKKVGKF